MRIFFYLLAALAVSIVALPTARAQYSNTDRYQIVSNSLVRTAPTTNSIAVDFASAWLDVPAAPFQLRRFDTPGNDSFGAGTQLGNTAAMVTELLQSIRTCGERCYVDLASLNKIDGVRNWVAGAIQDWTVGKPATARLILRITIGYAVASNSTMEDDVSYFKPTVSNANGRVEVYGIHMGSGPTFGVGTWSHVKTFGVYDLSSQHYKLLFGGQNHWAEYNNPLPPFDTNTMVDGNAALGEALQIDAAARWFGADRTYLGYALWWDAGTNGFGEHRYAVREAGYQNGLFGTFSGLVDSNPQTLGAPAPGQRALISLIDMGNYSVGHVGRTIARALHDLVAAEPKDNNIRVWQQQICRATGLGVPGNCSGRSPQTYVGALVYRAITAARLGWASNVWVLTSTSTDMKNKGYAAPYSGSTRGSLYETALAHVCIGDPDSGYWDYQPGWNRLRYFNNPRGRGSCYDAVVRAVNARFHMRMVRANLPGFVGPQWVGEHQKLVMFGREAMYQGSFNAYPSAVISGTGSTYESKLVENGAIILDADYVNDHVNAFETAWAGSVPIIGGE